MNEFYISSIISLFLAWITVKLFIYWIKNSKEDTFIEYIGIKYYHDIVQQRVMRNVCKVVKSRGQFTAEDLRQIQELGIPLGQITGFNLSGFIERTSPVSYYTFVAYLVNICDNKFTIEQIKQTIENGSKWSNRYSKKSLGYNESTYKLIIRGIQRACNNGLFESMFDISNKALRDKLTEDGYTVSSMHDFRDSESFNQYKVSWKWFIEKYLFLWKSIVIFVYEKNKDYRIRQATFCNIQNSLELG